jgi:acetyltransferase-like isoleucine patch superfamily enzyme
MLKAKKMYNIHETSIIADDVIIDCKEFTLGPNSVIKSGCVISCRKFVAKEGLFMCEGVEIGRGGNHGPNSNVYIGSNVGIFERTVINPSDEVYIGDNVGIGSEVMIWTHGAWLDVMQGFPSDFGPVHIGDNVWLPARSIVLPNVTIGSDTVIGIGSVVNKSIPSGSLAAGHPCKVIKENYYPIELSSVEKLKIVGDIINDYKQLAEYKNLYVELEYTENVIILTHNEGDTNYDLQYRTMSGAINDISEDFRDYLRRRGIKIFTNKPFKSIRTI